MTEEELELELATVEAMRQYGGSFVQALAAAYAIADMPNQALIRQTWPDYWKQYQAMAQNKENKPSIRIIGN